MSSPVRSIDTISASFFTQYDVLKQNAADLPLARDQLNKAQAALVVVDRELQEATTKVNANQANVKEQTKRIDLVSKHWFYGTTALQPQLWLRGGCTGKISRAHTKLKRALEEGPQLEQLVRELRDHQQPTLRAAVAERTATFNVCANAVAQREQMKETVVTQHPSPLLCDLREQVLTTQHETRLLQTNLDQLQQAKMCHDTAVTRFKEAKSSLEEAQRLEHKHEKASKATRSSQQSHARKCASPGCSYTTSTWHGTHCCNACQRRLPRGHGRQCERRVHCVRGTNSNTNTVIQMQLEQLDQGIHAKMTLAQSQVNAGLDQLRQAQTMLAIYTGDRVSSRTVTPQFNHQCPSRRRGKHSPSGLSNALTDVQTLLGEAAAWASHMAQVQSSVDVQRQALQQRSTKLARELNDEKERIFGTIRSHYVDSAQSVYGSTILPPSPSAPPDGW